MKIHQNQNNSIKNTYFLNITKVTEKYYEVDGEKIYFSEPYEEFSALKALDKIFGYGRRRKVVKELK